MKRIKQVELSSVKKQDNTYMERRYHTSSGVILCERRKANEIRAKIKDKIGILLMCSVEL